MCFRRMKSVEEQVAHMEVLRNEPSQNEDQWSARAVHEEEPPSLVEKLNLLGSECRGGPHDESRGLLGAVGAGLIKIPLTRPDLEVVFLGWIHESILGL